MNGGRGESIQHRDLSGTMRYVKGVEVLKRNLENKKDKMR